MSTELPDDGHTLLSGILDEGSTTLIKHKLTAEEIVYSLITVLTCVIGTIGNTLVIGALLVHKKLRVRSNVFIGNLAVADLFVSLVISPLNIVGVFYRSFYLKYYILCDFIGSVCIIGCNASVWIIAAITINRYVAICCSKLLYHRIYNRITIPLQVGGIWVLCFFINLPNFLGWSDHSFNAQAHLCLYDFIKYYTYTIYVILCGLVAPTILITLCYVRILLFARRIKQRLKKFSTSEDAQLTRIKTTDMRLLRTIAITWAMFIIMLTPFGVIIVFGAAHWSPSIFAFAIAIAHSNASVNSIIYGATNPNFREGYVQFLRQIFRCFLGPNPKTINVATVSSSAISTIDKIRQ